MLPDTRTFAVSILPSSRRAAVVFAARLATSTATSDPGDIAAGATAIDPSFIQGAPPQVTGTILTLGGGVVAQATANCLVK